MVFILLFPVRCRKSPMIRNFSCTRQSFSRPDSNLMEKLCKRSTKKSISNWLIGCWILSEKFKNHATFYLMVPEYENITIVSNDERLSAWNKWMVPPYDAHLGNNGVVRVDSTPNTCSVRVFRPLGQIRCLCNRDGLHMRHFGAVFVGRNSRTYRWRRFRHRPASFVKRPLHTTQKSRRPTGKLLKNVKIARLSCFHTVF